MRVMCIDGKTDPDSEELVDVIEGNVYTVIDEKKAEGMAWYKLAEMSFFSWYSSDGFIPISEIGETEFERSYNSIHNLK